MWRHGRGRGVVFTVICAGFAKPEPAEATTQ